MSKKGELVTVDIPIHVTGESKSDALTVTELNTVSVEADATAIPEFFEISVEDAEVGFQVFAKDLELPSAPPCSPTRTCSWSTSSTRPPRPEVEAELEEAEAEVGIERDESDEEAAAAAEATEGSESEKAGEGDTVPETDANNGQS